MARISVFDLISRSEKNMGAVDPKVKALAVELIKLAYYRGINVQITSGFRSYEEQNRLYAQGRTAPGNVVTNARAGYSIHNFGLAIDFVLVSEDGRNAIWSVTKEWREVAAIGKSLGFQWGGDWRSFPDAPHLDMQRGVTLAALRAGKRPSIPNVPNRNYSGQGDTGTNIKLYQGQLSKAGFPTAIDGFFGAGMEASVKAFQKAQGLSVDGLIGPATQRALSNPQKDVAAVTPVSKPKPTPPPPKPEQTQPKKGVIYLKPTTVTLQNEVYNALVKARQKNIISSDKWEKAMKAGTLTQDDAIALLFTIFNREN